MNRIKDPWQPLHSELEWWKRHGRRLRMWWRDDDAGEAGEPFKRLVCLAGRHKVPLLLAVIPANATAELGRIVERNPLLSAAVHGYAHVDHAGAGEKACELADQRGVDAVLAELGEGRRRLAERIANLRGDILVPPWNRIGEGVRARLADGGFHVLSTFADHNLAAAEARLTVVNCHLDIIDWKRARRTRDTSWLIDELAAMMRRRRQRPHEPIGVLTHHLVHDEAAWTFMDILLERTRASGQVEWIGIDEAISAATA